MARKEIKHAKGKRPRRDHRKQTLLEAAEKLGIPHSTLRNWSRRSDAPFTRNAATKTLRCDADELKRWADENKLTGKVGRPKQSHDDGDERSGDYWLARLRKVKALAAEGAVIPRTTHVQVITSLAQTSANKLRGLPAAAAPAAFGKTIPEIEAALQRFVDDICDQLSDPASYELPSADADELV